MVDDSFSVDPDEAQGLVPEGDYLVTIHKAVKVPPKTSDKYPYIRITTLVAEGQYEGEPITDQLSLSPEAKWRLAQLVKAANLIEKDKTGEQGFTCQQLVGQLVCVNVKHEEYKGVPRARPVRYWMPPGVQAATEQPGPAGEGEKKEGEASPAQASPEKPAPSKGPAAPAAAKAKPPVKV